MTSTALPRLANDTLEQRVEDRTRLIKDQAGQLRSLAVKLIKAE